MSVPIYFKKIGILLILVPCLYGFAVQNKIEKQWQEPTEKDLLIAHALGGIQGVTYSNSREAFLKNYEDGKRWFEVDLFLLKDSNLVCYHGDMDQNLGLKKGEVELLNVEGFVQLKFVGQFTLISFEDLLRMVKIKKDAYIVTDTKGWNQQKMDALLRHIKNVDPQLISKIIPQIYQPDDIGRIEKAEESAGKFHSLIFTLYLTRVSNNKVLAFVIQKGIPIVVVPVKSQRINDQFLEALHQHNKHVYIHTVNDGKTIEKWMEFGIDGFYTDFYKKK